jgi:hypothetical protein
MALLYDSLGNVIGDTSSFDPAYVDNPQSVKPDDVGYLQTKVNEFQNVLNMVDSTASMLESLLQTPDLSFDQTVQIQSQLDEYDTRKSAFKFAAESFNAVSSMVNAVGGSLGNVKIPTGLGFVFAPLLIPFAWASAIAGAAILVSWAMNWNQNSASIAAQIAATISDPVKRDEALALASSAASSNATSGGTLGSMADIVKYAAVAGALYIGYKMYKDYSKA